MARDSLTAGYRYQSLDILRGIASITVVIYHYHQFFFRPGETEYDPVHPQFILQDFPFFSLLEPIYFSGWKAVQLFFVLSGFIFFAIYHRKVNDRSVGGREFIILRFSRLYPLHFLTLLLVAGLQAASMGQNGDYLFYQYNDTKHFILNLFMVTDWGFKSGNSFNGPVWSVSIEILLYAVFFWLSRFMKFSLARCLIVAGLALFLWKVDYQISVGLVCFFAGGAAYYLNEMFLKVIHQSRLRALASLGVLVSALILFSLMPRQHFLYNRVLYFLVFPGFVLFLATLDRSFNYSLKSIRWIGDITYATYMIHVPIQMSILLLLGWAGVTQDFYNQWYLVAFLSVVIVLSILSYRYFEMPMQSALRAKGLRPRH